MLSICSTAFGLALCASSAWCQAPAPEFRAGETWTFEAITSPDRRDRFQDVVETADRDSFSVISGKGAKRSFSRLMLPLDANGREIQMLQFPLAVGNRWEGSFDWKVESGFGTNTVKYEVEKSEVIEVPAGKFEVFKITGFGFVNDRSTQYGSVQGQAKVVETYYYAPSVKRIIKYDGKTLKWAPPNFIETWARRYELNSFSLQ